MKALGSHVAFFLWSTSAKKGINLTDIMHCIFSPTGQSGVLYVVQVISRLLDPKTSEYTATFVGRLVSCLISKVGSELGENLDLMLRAVLSKMQQAQTLSVVQVRTTREPSWLEYIFAHKKRIERGKMP